MDVVIKILNLERKWICWVVLGKLFHILGTVNIIVLLLNVSHVAVKFLTISSASLKEAGMNVKT